MPATPPHRLTLFLMTEKGHAFLEGTVQRYGHLFERVVVGSDKALDNDWEDEIVALCQRHRIAHVRRAAFQGLEGDGYVIAVAWRWLIRHPPERIIVFHDSLLPRYRGFAPLVNALVKGEPEIGVTALFGHADFDTGPIVAQSRSRVTYPITIARAIAQVNADYLACAEAVLARLAAGEALVGTPQDESAATYSVWRDEDDYAIDWGRSAAEIRRLVDAVGPPYRGACTTWEGRRVRILAAEEVDDVVVENRDAGKVLFVRDGLPVVICGQGLLKLTEAFEETADGQREPLLPLRRFRVRFGR